MILSGEIPTTPVCHVPDCGAHCLDCGDRMSCYGPEPVPRCADHPTCTRCATHVVHCPECRAVLAAVAEDRAEQSSFDAGREAL